MKRIPHHRGAHYIGRQSPSGHADGSGTGCRQPFDVHASGLALGRSPGSHSQTGQPTLQSPPRRSQEATQPAVAGCGVPPPAEGVGRQSDARVRTCSRIWSARTPMSAASRGRFGAGGDGGGPYPQNPNLGNAPATLSGWGTLCGTTFPLRWPRSRTVGEGPDPGSERPGLTLTQISAALNRALRRNVADRAAAPGRVAHRAVGSARGRGRCLRRLRQA